MEHIVEAITEFFRSKVSAEVIIFIVSMLPVLELRGGLIAASLLGVEWYIAFPVCVIANMLPIPFVLLFIRRVFDFIKRTNFLWLAKVVTKLDERAERKSQKVEATSAWGLFLFVGIPLPGTGAWTGALVANALNVKFKRSIWIITLGVIVAGLITSLIAYVIPMLF